MTLAAEIAAALAEAGTATAGAQLVATFSRRTGGPATPWDAGAPTVTTFALTVLDSGWNDRFAAGDLTRRRAHVLTVEATGQAPQIGDGVTLKGATYTVLAVEPLAPGGEVLLYDVEING